MNPELTSAFDAATAGLLTVFGRPVVHANAAGDEATILAVIELDTDPLGEFGERRERRYRAVVASTSGAVVGDTLTHDGDPTTDEPYPEPVIWTLTQLLADDGFTREFSVRQ